LKFKLKLMRFGDESREEEEGKWGVWEGRNEG
jgi:hypothetical protein